jgi:hypothetical protein
VPRLNFAVESAAAVPFAATPTIGFNLRLKNEVEGQTIQSIALRCQIMIEAAQRHYQASERAALRDLFGEPDRWSQTLRSLLWTHANVTVPEFSGEMLVQLPVSCTFDFNVASAKYFHSLADGDIPLCFQFSGTMFYASSNGSLQIAQIGWDQETRFRLPATVWHEMMDLYYPNSAWLRLDRSVFERLYEHKRRHGFATWEHTVEDLLPLEKKAAS